MFTSELLLANGSMKIRSVDATNNVRPLNTHKATTTTTKTTWTPYRSHWSAAAIDVAVAVAVAAAAAATATATATFVANSIAFTCSLMNDIWKSRTATTHSLTHSYAFTQSIQHLLHYVCLSISFLSTASLRTGHIIYLLLSISNKVPSSTSIQHWLSPSLSLTPKQHLCSHTTHTFWQGKEWKATTKKQKYKQKQNPKKSKETIQKWNKCNRYFRLLLNMLNAK